MLDENAFQKCRDGVIIVNCARGQLIDTRALIRALESGKVGAAALDVMENENGLYYYNRVGDLIHSEEMAILRTYTKSAHGILHGRCGGEHGPRRF